jgi:predicted TIM-barrel fold metal-dependent hydrolase
VTRFDSLVHVTRSGEWPNGKDDASYARLVTELDRGGVDRACLVGLAGVVDNPYILECADASHARLVPIAGVDPSRCEDGAALVDGIARLARDGFAGIKLHPRLNGYDPLGSPCLQAIRAASEHRLTVFLDTLFRQQAHATSCAADIVDRMAHECPGASIVLLHGGGAALLDVADLLGVHRSLTLDLSFTLMRYAGSSLDADIRWVMGHLDQRIVIGSDMPEFMPAEAFARAEQLAEGLAAEKWDNMSHRNLERLFPARSPQPSA